MNEHWEDTFDTVTLSVKIENTEDTISVDMKNCKIIWQHGKDSNNILTLILNQPLTVFKDDSAISYDISLHLKFKNHMYLARLKECEYLPRHDSFIIDHNEGHFKYNIHCKSIQWLKGTK